MTGIHLKDGSALALALALTAHGPESVPRAASANPRPSVKEGKGHVGADVEERQHGAGDLEVSHVHAQGDDDDALFLASARDFYVN